MVVVVICNQVQPLLVVEEELVQLVVLLHLVQVVMVVLV
jgi:hypothetical protein